VNQTQEVAPIAQNATFPPPSYGGGTTSGAVPAVFCVSPATGPASGGTAITLRGTGLTGATSVRFGGTAAASFIVESDTEIAAVPPVGVGTVAVTVSAAGETSPVGPADMFTYTGLPVPSVPSACVNGLAAPAAFPDVPSSYRAHAYIEALACRGVVAGFPDGTFQPGGAVTRVHSPDAGPPSHAAATGTHGPLHRLRSASRDGFVSASSGHWLPRGGGCGFSAARADAPGGQRSDAGPVGEWCGERPDRMSARRC